MPTGYKLKDCSVANVFDAQNPKTVNRHFAWMKQYGIDGAFLQRFVNPAADRRQRPSLDRVLANVRAASKANGVAWGMMYDLSGVRADDIFPKVSNDWKYLVDEQKIRDDGRALSGAARKPDGGLVYDALRNWRESHAPAPVLKARTGPVSVL